MYHLIDACEQCGTFQRINLQKITDEGDVVAWCDNCINTFGSNIQEKVEPKKKVNYKKYKWKEVA